MKTAINLIAIIQLIGVVGLMLVMFAGWEKHLLWIPLLCMILLLIGLSVLLELSDPLSKQKSHAQEPPIKRTMDDVLSDCVANILYSPDDNHRNKLLKRLEDVMKIIKGA